MTRLSEHEKIEGRRGEWSRARKPAVRRGSSVRERRTNWNSVGTPSVPATAPHPEGTTTPPEHRNKLWSDISSGCKEVYRSNLLESPQSRGQTINALKRTNSELSAGGGSVGGLSVTASNDPEILKGEIRRLQAALMNEFKGGSRFVGGAQFKASYRKKTESCGGCLQVREALRRSRVESRDLRGSLFRAEALIKQLTLTKAVRRARHQAHDAIIGNEEKQKNAYFLSGVDIGGGSSSSSRNGEVDITTTSTQEGLVARVRQLERELRLADFRLSRSTEAGVSADHGPCGGLMEVSKLVRHSLRVKAKHMYV